VVHPPTVARCLQLICNTRRNTCHLSVQELCHNTEGCSLALTESSATPTSTAGSPSSEKQSLREDLGVGSATRTATRNEDSCFGDGLRPKIGYEMTGGGEGGRQWNGLGILSICGDMVGRSTVFSAASCDADGGSTYAAQTGMMSFQATMSLAPPLLSLCCIQVSHTLGFSPTTRRRRRLWLFGGDHVPASMARSINR